MPTVVRKRVKIADFIEKRRRMQGVRLEDLCRVMGITANGYRLKLRRRGFTEEEMLLAAKVLKFDVILLPSEADIFTA